jgi:hypothetical protein
MSSPTEDAVDGWPFSPARKYHKEELNGCSCPARETDEADTVLCKLDDVAADYHDGTVPRKLYGYSAQGRRLRMKSDCKTIHVAKHLNQQLKLLSKRVNYPYQSMTPFSLSAGEEAEDSSVHLELALHYRIVKRRKKGRYEAALLHSFFTPFHFYHAHSETTNHTEKCRAKYKKTKNDVTLIRFQNTSRDHWKSGCDKADGAGSGTNCQHSGHAFFLTCLGQQSYNASPQCMTVNQFGHVSCTGLVPGFRPNEFMVHVDTKNNTDTAHIVSILCLGMGPEDNYFLASVTDKGSKPIFAAIQADGKKDQFVPKDTKFHFQLTRATMTESQGASYYRFQAVEGRNYLAFDDKGQQVTVTADDVEQGTNNDLLKQSLFQFTPII